MIIGIGIDLVEIKDFQKNLYANKKILHRIFTTEECKLNYISQHQEGCERRVMDRVVKSASQIESGRPENGSLNVKSYLFFDENAFNEQGDKI